MFAVALASEHAANNIAIVLFRIFFSFKSNAPWTEHSRISKTYRLLSNAINNGLIDDNVILESLISFKRAGANAIISYYADRIDKILK